MQTFLNGGWGQIIIILAGIAFGVLFSNSRITDLRAHLDKRIDDSSASLSTRIEDSTASLSKRIDDSSASLSKRIDDSNVSLGKRIDDSNVSLRDFIHSEVSRLEARIERLEHPIFRP